MIKDSVDEKIILEQNKKNKKYVILKNADLWKIRPFTICKLSKDNLGIGMLLPETIVKIDDKGKIMYSKQILAPHIITSKGQFLPVNNKFEAKHKITFETIPTRQEIRWQLEDINNYTEGKKGELPIEMEDIFKQITNKYKEYIVMENPTWYKIHALWDMGTYFFMLFKYYPIFSLWGEKRTGKTKSMEISQGITLNATPIMINPTVSSLFRETNDLRPTKYIDEAEKIWKYDYTQKKIVSDDRAELLNASWEKGSKVPRTEMIGRSFKVIYYSCYSPTMLASIEGLRGATDDRSIERVCVRSPINDKRGEKDVDPEELFYQDIRNYLYRLLLNKWQEVEKNYKNFEKYSSTKNEANVTVVANEPQKDTLKEELKSRDLKIWQPLLVLAKMINEELYEEIKEFAEKQANIKKIDNADEGSYTHRIITATYELLQDGQNFVLLKAISKAIDSEHPPHSKTIAGYLDKLGLKDHKIRETNGYGYRITKDMFEVIIKRTYEYYIFNTLHTLHTLHTVGIEEEIGKDREELNEPNKDNDVSSVSNQEALKLLNERLEDNDNIKKSMLYLGEFTINDLMDRSVFNQMKCKRYIDQALKEGMIMDIGKGLYKVVV